MKRKTVATNARSTRAITTWAVLALIVAVPLLSACHTTAGAGEDISATGQAIDRTAKKVTP
jgi:predicted small secreted protein